MKTAISIPDKMFQSADRLAHRMGMSRSQLYVAAIKKYLDEHRGDRVTEKLNQVYGEIDSRLDPVLQSMQSRTLRKHSEW